jgi:hypothetical protein
MLAFPLIFLNFGRRTYFITSTKKKKLKKKHNKDHFLFLNPLPKAGMLGEKSQIVHID